MLSLRPFMLRGWLLLGSGALALLLAITLGRRDLLMLAIFCLALPGAACAGLLWFKPGFAVKRRISPVWHGPAAPFRWSWRYAAKPRRRPGPAHG